MKTWNLATRSGFYVMSDDGVREDILESVPLVVDPSITFRKHFELPQAVDRDPDTLRLELFSRFLPADLDQYICQFTDGELTENNTKNVLGLAVKKKDFQWLEGLHGEGGQKFILENLLSPPEDQNCSFKLHLPEGIYFGVFVNGFLSWARYLKNPDDDMLEKTQDYVRNEFPMVESSYQSPAFSLEDTDSEWKQFTDNWLPSNPDQNKILSSSSSVDFWSNWKTTAWTLLLLAGLTALVWWAYNFSVIRQNRGWLQARGKQFLGSTNNPHAKLESEIKSMRDRLESTKKSLDIYPRIGDLDEALKDFDLRILQIKVKGNQAQLVLMTNSLKTAEDLQSRLLDQNGVSRTEIVSTNPQQQGKYQFKVNINVLWSSSEQQGQTA